MRITIELRYLLPLVAAILPGLAASQSAPSAGLTLGMGISQRLGDSVPKDIKFKDEDGKTVRLGDMFHGRPVVLVPIFYGCQTGCSVLSEQIIQTLAKANKSSGKLVVGQDLDIVMLSIFPKETSALAHSKKAFLLHAFEPPHATPAWWTTTGGGWHLLTGDYASIRKVTDAIGLTYRYNEQKNLINHPTCTVILSPAGRISSYTIGNDFPTRLVEDDLVLAARNEVGPPADQSMMFGCIMIDPVTGKYRVVVENILRLACALTVIILVAWIGGMILRERQDAKKGPLGVSR